MELGLASTRLDDKGRMILPKRFREEFEESWDKKAILTIDIYERLLILYKRSYWAEVVKPSWQSISGNDRLIRKVRRTFLGSSCELHFDGAWRAGIPPLLKKYANIEDEVVIQRINGKSFEMSSPATDVLSPLDTDQPVPEALREVIM